MLAWLMRRQETGLKCILGPWVIQGDTSVSTWLLLAILNDIRWKAAVPTVLLALPFAMSSSGLSMSSNLDSRLLKPIKPHSTWPFQAAYLPSTDLKTMHRYTLICVFVSYLFLDKLKFTGVRPTFSVLSSLMQMTACELSLFCLCRSE